MAGENEEQVRDLHWCHTDAEHELEERGKGTGKSAWSRRDDAGKNNENKQKKTGNNG